MAANRLQVSNAKKKGQTGSISHYFIMVLERRNINTAPRSNESQFSLVKDRISWSKSKYFLLQHSERW